jgi:hypothetical protein
MFHLIYNYKFGWYLLILFCLVTVILFSIRVPAAVYNFAFLIPILIFVSFDTQKSSCFRSIRWSITTLVGVGALASSVSLAHQSAMSILALHEGRDAASVQEALQRLPAEATVAFTSPSFALVATPILGKDRVLTGEGSLESDFRVQGQAYSGQMTPRLQPGECIFYSTFHTRSPAIFGIPIARTYKDWAFALIESCR